MATQTIQAYHFHMVVTGGHLFDFYTTGIDQGGGYLKFEPSPIKGTVIGKQVRIDEIVFLSAVIEDVEIEVPDVPADPVTMNIQDLIPQNEENYEGSE